MEKLPKTFTLGNIESNIEESVNVMFNLSAINSFEGDLVFTEDKLYFIFQAGSAGMLLGTPWCIGYDEIAEYSKTGLAGFKISLKTGEKLKFSNVFRGAREKIVSGIQAHKQ